MFVLREALPDDLDGLLAVARHLDSVNLPDDRDELAAILQISAASFAGAVAPSERQFVFVLVDEHDGREAVVGTSMIFARHGTRRAPHVFFDVLTDERYSETLDKHVVHRVLRIGYNYEGMTEIGGLVLQPALRRHPRGLGRLLAAVRFMYMAGHRAVFLDEVLSELMPPLEPDGTSQLWEHLGRHFTGLTYQEADRLSRRNKEFIRTLFPQEPLYATLLPPHVQALIGQVGPDAKGVEHLLRRLGFVYAHRIDPFDGGPHFHARIDEVAYVRGTRRLMVTAHGAHPIATAAPETRLLVAVERPGAPRARFLATVAEGPGVALDGDMLALPDPLRRRLDLQAGDVVLALAI